MVRASKYNNKVLFKGVSFPNSPEYQQEFFDWQQRMYYEKGYTVPIGEIIDRLGVSRTWIHNTLNEYVSFVQYSADFLKSITEDNLDIASIPYEADTCRGGVSYIYYNIEQLSQWLIANSTYTVQTMLVDAGEYYTPHSELARMQFFKGLPINDTKKKTDSYVTEIKLYRYQELSECLNRDIVCDRKRSIFAEVPYPAFNYWDDDVIFFNAEQIKNQHRNYLRFVEMVAPSRVNETGDHILPMAARRELGVPCKELNYEFARHSTEAVARMAFHLSLVKIHLKVGTDRGKVFYAYRPEYRNLTEDNYKMPVLVSVDDVKHDKFVQFFSACINANGMLTPSEAAKLGIPYPTLG